MAFDRRQYAAELEGKSDEELINLLGELYATDRLVDPHAGEKSSLVNRQLESRSVSRENPPPQTQRPAEPQPPIRTVVSEVAPFPTLGSAPQPPEVKAPFPTLASSPPPQQPPQQPPFPTLGTPPPPFPTLGNQPPAGPQAPPFPTLGTPTAQPFPTLGNAAEGFRNPAYAEQPEGFDWAKLFGGMQDALGKRSELGKILGGVEGELGEGAGGPAVAPIARAVKDAFELWKQGMGDVKDGMLTALTAQRAGDIASGAGQAVFGLGSMEGGGKGNVLRIMGSFIQAVGDGTNSLQDFVKGLHASNVRFAEFSGGMAQVQVNQQMREIELAQKRGDRRSESAELLAKEMNDLNVNLARVEDKWANLQNTFIAALLAAVNPKLKEVLDKLLGKEEEDTSKGETMTESLAAVGRDTMRGGDEGFGRPPRLSWHDYNERR